jgi:hypothetical protein
MIKLGPNSEQYLQPIRMLERFPTAAYVAGRLKKLGWDSSYGKSLLNTFRDDLIRECGSEFSEVLLRFRLVSPRGATLGEPWNLKAL